MPTNIRQMLHYYRNVTLKTDPNPIPNHKNYRNPDPNPKRNR